MRGNERNGWEIETLRIAHVTPFFPPNVGGMERCVSSLVEKQVKQGHKVLVFTSDFPKSSSVSTPWYEGAEIHRLESLRVLGSPFTPSLGKELLKHQLDMIHAHVFHFYYPEIGIAVSRLRDIPFVSHVHLDPDPPGAFLLHRLYKRVSAQAVITLSDAVIVPTAAYASLLRSKYRRTKRVFVIPNGVDPVFLSTSPVTRTKTCEIVYVGRICYQKGLDILVDAMRRIVDREQDAKLTVVGPVRWDEGQGYLNLVRDMTVRLGIADHVDFIHNATDGMLRTILGRARVLVAPSRFESFGMVLLEAMASGTPIVASDIPPFREVADDAAVFYKNSEELVDAVIRLMHDDVMRAKLIAAGKERVRDYTWDRISRSIATVYDLCLRERTREFCRERSVEMSDRTGVGTKGELLVGRHCLGD